MLCQGGERHITAWIFYCFFFFFLRFAVFRPSLSERSGEGDQVIAKYLPRICQHVIHPVPFDKEEGRREEREALSILDEGGS